MKNVTIYTTPTCHFCKDAKAYFEKVGVSYETVDVAADVEKRKEMVNKSGQMGVPVITVGEEVVVGFNKAKLDKLLGFHKPELAYVASDPADDTQCESCQ